MSDYPSYLPKPLIDYSFSNNNRTIQTSFESGRISQRSLATKQRDIIDVIFQYNFFQLGIWESFVQTTLSNGALQFTINLPDSTTQEVSACTVLLSEGKYQTQSVSGTLYWRVKATLIRQDKTAFTQEELDLFAAIDGDYLSFISYGQTFHSFVHETLPTIT